MSGSAKLGDLIVVNSSPLITLTKSSLDYILPELFTKIVVPGAVWQEISAYKDSSWKKLLNAEWLSPENVAIDFRILLWNLGKGESEVLSCSLKNSRYIAVIDDLAARKCSNALDIRHIGTAGILVLANRFKIIPSLADAFTEIKKAGLYLKDDLITRLLEKESL